jgi:pyruvate dehydrogenase E1 component beta subunit
MPTTPHDAKGLLIAAIEDDNPVVFIEHRWLHHIKGEVPAGHYTVPIGPARLARAGRDVTIVALSYMVLEALEAAEKLAEDGIEAEVIDVRSLRPLNQTLLLASLAKTGHLVVADTGHSTAGMAAEIIAIASERAFGSLKAAPRRVCFPECPTPTSHTLAAEFYPRAGHIAAAARTTLQRPPHDDDLLVPAGAELDKPNPAFTGPF